MKRLCITGGNSFVGLQLIIDALKQGFELTITVRRSPKKEYVERIISQQLSAEDLKNCRFVYTDCCHPEGWNDAVEDCDAILHTASPFPLTQPKDPNDAILPATLGVKHVMEAALNQGVNRIIQTSSIASVMYGTPLEKPLYTESDWSDETGTNSPYYLSKLRAEKLFWDYGKNNNQLKLTSLCPGLILGPLFSQSLGSSANIIYMLMSGKYPGVPSLSLSIIDNRDVSDLHFLMLENDISIGERYIATSQSLWMKELAEVLLTHYPTLHKKIKAKVLPKWFLKLYSLIDGPTKLILPELGIKRNAPPTKAMKDLGFTPRSIEDAIIETASSIVDHGLVKV